MYIYTHTHTYTYTLYINMYTYIYTYVPHHYVLPGGKIHEKHMYTYMYIHKFIHIHVYDHFVVSQRKACLELLNPSYGMAIIS